MAFKCDFKDCKRIPYAEVYPLKWDEERNGWWFDSNRGWSYLCRWHYYYAKYILRDKFGAVIIPKEKRKIHKLLRRLAKKEINELKHVSKEFGLKEEDTKYDLKGFMLAIIEEIKEEIEE